ncbi:MAG: peptidoglycan editing factor PgeF [Colwellia sp.]|nr:peptidoglycan editing factor PgeF [Colwellia sp.]
MALKNISPYLHYVSWPAQNVLAFTTTRRPHSLISSKFDNFSKFSAFNLGDHVGDKHENVVNNRNTLLSILPKNSVVQWFEQVHGNDVAIIESFSEHVVIADAAITKQKNIALAIMTADCLPIVLSTRDGDEIAVIHGGWRPLVKDIINHTVNKMAAVNKDIVAWLGPCIGADVFEVGEEVKEQFIQQSPIYEQAFILQETFLANIGQSGESKYLANLSLIARLQLNQLGIFDINELSHCTFSRNQEYFSYRRDGQTGRMATIICRQ